MLIYIYIYIYISVQDIYIYIFISVQDAFDRKDSKAFYEGIKKVFGPQESGISPIAASDGTLLTD